MDNAIKIEFCDFSIGEIRDSLKEGIKRAEVRQLVKHLYPTKQVNSGSLYSTDEFGIDNKVYESERVVFLDVPANETPEGLLAKIEAHPNARIYRILGLKPYITANQQRAIDKGLLDKDNNPITEETIAKKQLVPKLNESGDVMKDDAGNNILNLYKDKYPMYRVCLFSINSAEDVDTRDADIAEFAKATAKAETITV